MAVKTITIKDFQYGTIDSLEERSLPRGAVSRSLNWLTKTDHTELRAGFSIFGEDSGVGKITGLYVAKMANGTEVKFRTRGQILETYNTTTEVWDEVGTNVLGSAANGKDISFAEYHSIAGDQLFVNSPYGPFLKIMLANPTSYTDLYNASKNYKGYIKVKQNRMFLWGRTADPTGLYMSFIDERNNTLVSAESISGSGNTRSGTLAFKGGGSKRTCFAVTFTDGTETFTDNNDGTLTGSAGGTGTINYMTGAYSITFNASAVTVTATYQWEDSTDGGLADFTYSGTRVAGEGLILRQDDGGPLKTVESYEDKEYCIHTDKTWVVTLSADDTDATNLIYREKVGIDSWRGAVSTGDGIYYIDTSDIADPQIRVLAIPYGMDKVIPSSVSKARKYEGSYVGKDLSSYLFDKTVGTEYKDYIIFICRTSDSTENNVMILYHKKQRSIDLLDIWATTLSPYENGLLVGDTTTANVLDVFTGLDDNEFNIDNYLELNRDDLNWYGEKKLKKLKIRGKIGVEQAISVYAAVDGGSYVLLGTISGSSNDVTSGSAVVGRNTIGTVEVGGGGSGSEFAEFLATIRVGLGKFNNIKLKFVADELGVAHISEATYYDFRVKNNRIKN